ncbi:hypothetical protein DY000_02003236 [Brassica cretica]|uniref:Ig-like domain-containing protein n=1 Tax=Brassica cretica TaxID=69181 RepID=A0ABQ7C9M4_BRACR|nr:hypothetical protein DY000_02003236 [Brassica cretica]
MTELMNSDERRGGGGGGVSAGSSPERISDEGLSELKSRVNWVRRSPFCRSRGVCIEEVTIEWLRAAGGRVEGSDDGGELVICRLLDLFLMGESSYD